MPRHLYLAFALGLSVGCSPFGAFQGRSCWGALTVQSERRRDADAIALAVEKINADGANNVLGRKLKVVHADAGACTRLRRDAGTSGSLADHR